MKKKKAKTSKLLILTPIFPPSIGGPATYTAQICELLKKDYEISVIFFHPQKEKPVNIDGCHLIGISYKEIYSTKKHQFLNFFKKISSSFSRQLHFLIKLIPKALKTDLIYIQQPVVVGFLGSIIGKICRKNTILKFVGDIAWEQASNNKLTIKNLPEFLAKPPQNIKIKLLKLIQKTSFTLVNKIIVPSEFLKEILIDFYKISPEKIVVIRNAIALKQKYNKALTLKNNNKILKIITIGRLVEWKNISGILQALNLLQNVNFELKVIGFGPLEKKLQQEAKDLKLDNKVIFCGQLEKSLVYKHLKNSDLFILNSNYEGLPHVVIEAMLSNCAVISSDIAGSNEIAINLQTALTCKPNSPQDLAQKIKKIYNNPLLAEKLVKNAKKFAEKNFSWQTNLPKLKKVLKK